MPALVDQLQCQAGLVDVVVALIANFAKGLDANRQLAPHQSGSGRQGIGRGRELGIHQFILGSANVERARESADASKV